MAISGDCAVVGCENTKEVHVFERTGSAWNWVNKLEPPPPTWEANSFGHSVAISGNYVVVGELKGNNNAGSAYIFESDVFNTT